MPRMSVRCGVPALLLACRLLSAAGWAQLAPSPDAPPVSTAPAPAPDEQSVATFKLRSTWWTCFSPSRTSREPGSPPHQERLHHHGRQGAAEAQELRGRDSAAADAGNSAGYFRQPGARAAAGAGGGRPVSQRVLRQKDEAFLLSFDVNVDLLQDFTNSARLLRGP